MPQFYICLLHVMHHMFSWPSKVYFMRLINIKTVCGRLQFSIAALKLNISLDGISKHLEAWAVSSPVSN